MRCRRLLAALAFLLAFAGGKAARAQRPSPYRLVGPIVRGESHVLARWIEAVRANGGRVLPVVITSNGGDAREGLAMVRLLRTAGLPSVCEVQGVAGSAAFLVLQACTVCIAAPDARLSTHQPQARLAMNLTLERAQDLTRHLRALTDVWDRLIARRMQLPLHRYRRQVANGQSWTMSSAAALRHNAIDRIAGRSDAGIAFARRSPDGSFER